MNYFSNNRNCLANAGSYIDTWEDDSTLPLAQAVSVHEQCRLIYGEGFSYDVSLN